MHPVEQGFQGAVGPAGLGGSAIERHWGRGLLDGEIVSQAEAFDFFDAFDIFECVYDLGEVFQ
ncbi:MAG: hypothetical protein AB1664_07385, partial [Thermodesulfobacteriota bacterium]